MGVIQYGGQVTVVMARSSGKTNFAAAVAHMQAKYGGPPLTPWQIRVLESGEVPDGQDGFVMVTEDGAVNPVPPPAEDGSGYTCGGIPSGPAAGQQIASGFVVYRNTSINAARAGHGLPPLSPPHPHTATQQQAVMQIASAFGILPGLAGTGTVSAAATPNPPSPGRKLVPSRKPSGPAYSRGMDGFADWELPEPDGEIPDVYGVVRGYRWWTLGAPPLHESPARADLVWSRGLLRGMQATWEPGENRAACRAGSRLHPEETVPDTGCGCGFWAYWHLQRHETGGSALPVCGVIEGYGAVLIGEKGFRAAKARIVALHLPFTIQPATEADDDPLGLGLPPQDRPATRSGYSPRTPGGQRNPWWNHPQFPGKVHNCGGKPDPDDDLAALAGLARDPAPVPDLPEPSADERQAARDAAEAWMAVIGDRLARMYPDAKVFETRAAMEAEYPPDTSYVPDRDPCTCSTISTLALTGPGGHKYGCPLYS